MYLLSTDIKTHKQEDGSSGDDMKLMKLSKW